MKSENDLLALQKHIYEALGYSCSEPEAETESREYLAHHFKITHHSIRYRQAKVTPTKIGQFVTLWKRSAQGPIAPYDALDSIDYLIVTVKAQSRMGQFIFPKNVLIKKGILSVKGKGGKRAFRLYPPWDKAESRQAEQTQSWQSDYFVEIENDKPLDQERIKGLFQAVG